MACHPQIDADPDPSYHFDADSDADPAYHFDADADWDPTLPFNLIRIWIHNTDWKSTPYFAFFVRAASPRIHASKVVFRSGKIFSDPDAEPLDLDPT